MREILILVALFKTEDDQGVLIGSSSTPNLWLVRSGLLALPRFPVFLTACKNCATDEHVFIQLVLKFSTHV
jgi:hypothetical protein